MRSARSSDLLPLLVAAALALDQRIELQLPLVVLLAMWAGLRAGVDWHPGRAALALFVAFGYVALNTAVMFIENVRVADNWWAAPARIWLYYVLLIAMATLRDASAHREDDKFRVLEWLFVLKVLLIAFEGLMLLRTGELRERPFFNVVLAEDALLGVRFTSSYDFIFALLALSPRHQFRRLTILALAILISETRAFFLLSLVLLLWRVVNSRGGIELLAKAAIPACIAVAAIAVLNDGREGDVRLLQVSGSSLGDKLEQVEAVKDLIFTPYLLTGQGLGVALPGIVRDELRPYSYEAQVPVLLMQGGVLFFLVHIGIVWAYVRTRRMLSIALILGLGMLNPTLFSLASAYFLVHFGSALDQVRDKRQPIRSPALHAQW